MAKLTKRMKSATAAVQPGKFYGLEEALKIVKDNATAKFAESVDVAVRLGIDAKKSDQGVRGSSLLPHGTGKTVKVAVFCPPGEKAEAAKAGQVKFRNDKAGIIHATIGKASFEASQLADNLNTLIADLLKAKPSTAKGQFLQKVALSSTMGVGVAVDTSSLNTAAK